MNLSIKNKLLILVLSSLIVLTTIFISVSIVKNTEKIEKEKLNQLKSITVAKEQHLKDYFDSIKSLIISAGNMGSTADALYYFDRFFKKIEAENKTEVNIDEIKSKLISHYENFYINDINFKLKDIPSKKTAAEYLPKSNDGLIAQYVYIVAN